MCQDLFQAMWSISDFGLYRLGLVYLFSVKFGSKFRSNKIILSLLGWTKPICIGRHTFGDHYRATNAVIKGPGKLKLGFVPEGKDDQIEMEVYNFTGAGGVALAMYNTDEVQGHFPRSVRNSMEVQVRSCWDTRTLTHLKNGILLSCDAFENLASKDIDALSSATKPSMAA